MEGSGNAWHAPNILGAANNAAMATDINANPGAIGYMEYSYLLIPGNAAIQTASLQDREGQWLQPTLTNIAAAGAAAGTNITPDNFSIVNEGRQERLATRDLQLGHRGEEPDERHDR